MLARLLRICGRPEEALPALEAAFEACHTANYKRRGDPTLAYMMIGILNYLGRYERAVEIGKWGEQGLDAESGQFANDCISLYTGLATAYEGLGDMGESMHCTEAAVDLRTASAYAICEQMSYVHRLARRAVQRMEHVKAEEALKKVTQFYERELENGLEQASPAFESVVLPSLRLLVEVKRALGKPRRRRRWRRI